MGEVGSVVTVQALTGQQHRGRHQHLYVYLAYCPAPWESAMQPLCTCLLWAVAVPQVLQDEYSGFMSDKIVADYNAFAATLFELFGDRVSRRTL